MILFFIVATSAYVIHNGTLLINTTQVGKRVVIAVVNQEKTFRSINVSDNCDNVEVEHGLGALTVVADCKELTSHRALIIGISVGSAAIIGIVVSVLICVYTIRSRNQRTKATNERLRQEEMPSYQNG